MTDVRPYAARRVSSPEGTRPVPVLRLPSHGQAQPLQPAAMREMNMGSLLRALRVLGPRARVELAEYTGISPATVTKLVANLTEAEILVERADTHSLRLTGRPRVPVDFNPHRRAVLALHLGPDSITAAALDLRGTVLVERSADYPDGSAARSVQAGARLLARVVKALPDQCVAVGVGVTSAGRVDREHGAVRGRRDRGWDDVLVSAPIADHLGLPVELDQPVRGEALAALATDEQAQHLIHLSVGKEISAALLIDRHVHRGHTGEAGGVTHLPVPGARGPECGCGQTGCLGAVATDVALVEAARAKKVIGGEDGYAELVAAADDRSRPAVALLRTRARAIGQALAVLADLVDPDRLLVGGSALAWGGFQPEVEQTFVELSGRRADLLRFGPGPVEPVVAAGMLFLDRYFDDPVRHEPELQRRLNA